MAKLLSGTRIYGTAIVDTTLNVSGTATSTSTAGVNAIVASGGVSVAKDLLIGGSLYVAGSFFGATVTATSISSQFTINNTAQSTSTTTGALIVKGGLGVGGNVTVGGLLVLRQSQEVFQTKTTATGIVVHDYATGGTFLHTGISSNFTANVTNLDPTYSRSSLVCLILVQGAVPYICTEIQIAGVPQTINWAGGVIPGGTANKVEAMVFDIFNVAGTYTILGQLGSYG